MCHNATTPHRSERVVGQHFSTRAELAAVVMALQETPQADDLAILTDSAAAIHRLRWFRSHDFRLAEHKVKDYDIIHDILHELKLRSESSSRTLFVKVHGHSDSFWRPTPRGGQTSSSNQPTKKVMSKTLYIQEAEAKSWFSMT